jgi:hypothetical protein
MSIHLHINWVPRARTVSTWFGLATVTWKTLSTNGSCCWEIFAVGYRFKQCTNWISKKHADKVIIQRVVQHCSSTRIIPPQRYVLHPPFFFLCSAYLHPTAPPHLTTTHCSINIPQVQALIHPAAPALARHSIQYWTHGYARYVYALLNLLLQPLLHFLLHSLLHLLLQALLHPSHSIRYSNYCSSSCSTPCSMPYSTYCSSSSVTSCSIPYSTLLHFLF